MTETIQFPNANEAQNKILNKISEQKAKEVKARKDQFDKEKDKEEFLYLWKHFERRLRKILNDFRDELQPTGYHSMVITVKIMKDGATDDVTENFVYSDQLKLNKIVEI
jgi:hypothetical protein